MGRSVGPALAAVVIGLGLGACGDSKKTSSTSTPTTTQAPPTTTVPPVQEPTSTTTTTNTTAGATAPGTTLSLGDTAHVTIKPLNASLNSKKTYEIDATAIKIEKGTMADFKNITLDAAQKKSTPYYVTVKVSNPGGTVPVKGDDPDVRFDGIDDRGQEQGSVTFLGSFPRCEDNDAPNPFTKGKSYESCLTYLVPGGGSIVEVHWTGSDDYITKPVVWK